MLRLYRTKTPINIALKWGTYFPRIPKDENYSIPIKTKNKVRNTKKNVIVKK
jgi:hypothetical protein